MGKSPVQKSYDMSATMPWLGILLRLVHVDRGATGSRLRRCPSPSNSIYLGVSRRWRYLIQARGRGGNVLDASLGVGGFADIDHLPSNTSSLRCQNIMYGLVQDDGKSSKKGDRYGQNDESTNLESVDEVIYEKHS
jgi:hypothetical protein